MAFADNMTERCFVRSDLPKELAANYDDLVRRIHLEVWRPENDFRPGDTVESISERLRKLADRACAFAHAQDATSVALIKAEIVVAWMRSNVEYWTELNAKPGAERVAWNAPERVLSHTPRPKCNCDGFGRLTKALADRVGVKCLGVGGTLRSIGDGTIPNADEKLRGLDWNHGWNVFIVGGKYLPADTSNSWKFIDTKFRTGWFGKTGGSQSLPLDLVEWDLFLASHYWLHTEGQPVPTDELTTLEPEAWRAIPIGYAKAIETELRLRDTERNKRLARSESGRS